jgi:XTP/dITP diphosphohydrolase
MTTFTLVLGTRNKKKRRELEYLLKPHGIELKTLDDFSDSIEVEETGNTFAENAALKAVGQANAIKEWVLGEDSGISVDALDGAPGIYSARFSGEAATDESNNQLMLEKLAGVPLEKRTAWYTCHMTLADPDGNVRIECEGRCYGRILESEFGTAGFGYDPMFELQEYHQTFGQLGDAVKAIISHRARANRMFVPQLTSLIHEIESESRKVSSSEASPNEVLPDSARQELEQSWQVTRTYLAAARSLAPSSQDSSKSIALLKSHDENLAHNELELALADLEMLGKEVGCEREYWLALVAAAEQMGLDQRAVALRNHAG